MIEGQERWRNYSICSWTPFWTSFLRVGMVLVMQQLLCSFPFTFRVRMVNIPSHWWTLGNLCVCVCACSFSCVQFFVTLWTVAFQAPLSMGFSWQEYWSGLPCPPPILLSSFRKKRIQKINCLAQVTQLIDSNYQLLIAF